MKNFFNRILVPVVSDKELNGTITHAIELSNDLGCDLHLLHVQHTSELLASIKWNWLWTESYLDPGADEQELSAMTKCFRGSMADGLLLTASGASGRWQMALKEAVITHDIDLVLLPSRPGRQMELLGRININKLAQQTQCPVLTMSDFQGFQLQNIVVPIRDFLPLRKLTAATFLAKKFNGIVHLLGQTTQRQQKEGKSTLCLTEAYQLLRNYTRVKVHCSMDKDGDMAQETLNYAREVQADLIVVNPGTESRVGGFFRNWFRNGFTLQSNIPVLTIAPQA